jgi:hypothetical protein
VVGSRGDDHVSDRALQFPTQRQRAMDKGRIIGQKRPLKPKDVWAIRVRLELRGDKRGLALFQFGNRQQIAGLRLGEVESR